MDIEKPLFRRIAEENNEIPDVWIYDELPKYVRVQIIQILLKFFNLENFNGECDKRYSYNCDYNNNFSGIIFCTRIVNYIRHEIGIESLINYSDGRIRVINNSFEELREFFCEGLNECDENTNFRYALTVVDEICKGLGKKLIEELEKINKVPIKSHHKVGEKLKEALYRCIIIKRIADTIDEINYRLKEARIGWTFDVDAGKFGELIRIDNDVTYQLAVKPAFRLLSDSRFQESASNFLKAFESYQEGSQKGRESAVDYAVKALESTIRNICVIKEYSIDKNATLKPLIQTLIDNKFLPKYQDDFLNALPKIFMTGGVIGNRETRHGKEDSKAKETSALLTDNLVNFVLSQTASTIVFLVGIATQMQPENKNDCTKE